MAEKRGIKNGTLWGFVILILYAFLFFGIGFFLVWKSTTPNDFFGWIKLAFSYYGYLVAGLLTLIPVLGIVIYFVFRDENIKETFKNNWPIFLMLLYWIFPDPIPGPIDDVIVGGIAASFQVWFYIKRREFYKEAQLTNEEVDSIEEKIEPGRKQKLIS